MRVARGLVRTLRDRDEVRDRARPWHRDAVPDLVTLELSDCGIGDAGAIALAKSTRFPRLAKLDLSSNRLTRDGAIAFASPAIPTLTSLGIGNSSFPSGIFADETEIDGATGMEMG